MTRTTFPGTWFLEITLLGKDLFSSLMWTQSPKGHFYIFSVHYSNENSCDSSASFYCASWGCETSWHIYWKAKVGDFITMYLRGQDFGISMRCKQFVSMNNLYSCKGSNTVYPNKGTSFTDKGKRLNLSGVFCEVFESTYEEVKMLVILSELDRSRRLFHLCRALVQMNFLFHLYCLHFL